MNQISQRTSDQNSNYFVRAMCKNRTINPISNIRSKYSHGNGLY